MPEFCGNTGKYVPRSSRCTYGRVGLTIVIIKNFKIGHVILVDAGSDELVHLYDTYL